MISSIVNLVVTSVSLATPVINETKIETNAEDAAEIYSSKMQDDFTSDLVTNIGTGAVGTAVGAGIGTAIVGPVGTVIGGAVGTVVGAILGALVSNDSGKVLPPAENPNHYYAMGTGAIISSSSATSNKNCNGYSYNASNC